MNGEQLFATLQTQYGWNDKYQGHANVLLDVWTGRVMSVTFHPEKDVRSMTVLVASCEMEARNGTLLAGGLPTVHGDMLDGWLDVCNRVIEGAALVATAYCLSLFDEIGWSAEAFLISEAYQAMTSDDRFAHMNARLNQGATAKFVNRMGSLSLDLEGEARDRAIKSMELSDMYLGVVAKVLSEVDGQG